MEESQQSPQLHEEPVKRPFGLTLLSVFTIVFFGIFSLLFLVSLFYSGALTRVINQYLPEHPASRSQVFLLTLAGFLLHAAALTGIFLILKLKKTGYLIFGISTLIIGIYQLFQDKISFLTTSVYILFILLFGLFYKKLK